jgi:hypothetical protein
MRVWLSVAEKGCRDVACGQLRVEGWTYIFEVVQEVCDGFALRICKYVFVVDFRTTWWGDVRLARVSRQGSAYRTMRREMLTELTSTAREQFATEIGHAGAAGMDGRSGALEGG